MLNAYISGTGFFAPPRVVTNHDLRTVYGMDTSDEWVEQRTASRSDASLTTGWAAPISRSRLPNKPSSVPDQANLRINQHIQQQIGAPAEKFINNIQRYGNTTAATLPSLLFEAEQTGRLKRGMKVVMVAFGAGFTWGCSIVDW